MVLERPSTRLRTKRHTGIPDEHDIPAPVITTIFLHFATARDRSLRERLVEKSALLASKSRVTGDILSWIRIEVLYQQEIGNGGTNARKYRGQS
jgi:hypothetical protein